eukprot:scaffold32495_cov60-Phaeocystis_antarctica.AAC.2
MRADSREPIALCRSRQESRYAPRGLSSPSMVSDGKLAITAGVTAGAVRSGPAAGSAIVARGKQTQRTLRASIKNGINTTHTPSSNITDTKCDTLYARTPSPRHS